MCTYDSYGISNYITERSVIWLCDIIVFSVAIAAEYVSKPRRHEHYMYMDNP